MNGKTIPMGPAPTEATAAELSAAKMRVLKVVDSFESPATVVQIAERAGGHPNTSRVHLDELVTEGFVECSRNTPQGRGRPALRYAVTALGRSKLTEPAQIDHRALSLALAQQFAVSGDADDAEQFGVLWARALSSTLPQDDEGLTQQLVNLLASMGFALELTEGGQAVLLHTCPMVAEARQDPHRVCGMHKSLIDGALRAWGSTSQVDLEPFVAPGYCRARLGTSTEGSS